MADNIRKTYRSLQLQEIKKIKVDLPELETLHVYQAPNFQPYYQFDCKPQHLHHHCPCSQKSTDITYLHKSYTRIVSDACVHIFGRSDSEYLVDLSLNEPKYRCNTCSQYYIFSHSFDCIQPGYAITKRLFHQVGRDSYFYSQRDLAEKYGISKTRVQNIHADTDKLLNAQLSLSQAPQNLAIFNISIPDKGSGEKGFAVLIDAETGLSVGSSKSNSQTDISTAIRAMPGYQSIRKVYSSMRPSYYTTIEHLLPRAKLIVDKYSAYQELEKSYKELISNLKDCFVNNTHGTVDGALIAEASKLLSHLHPINRCFPQFTERQNGFPNRDKIMEKFRDIAFLLKFERAFFEIYLSRSKYQAMRRFDDWSNLLPPDGKWEIEEWEDEHRVSRRLYQPLAKFGKLAHKWKEEILNYFDDLSADSSSVIMHTDYTVSALSIQKLLQSFSCADVRTLWDHWSVLKNPITFEVMGLTPDRKKYLPYNDYWSYCHENGFDQWHSSPSGYKIVDTTKIEERKPICVFDHQFPEQYFSLSSNGILL